MNYGSTSGVTILNENSVTPSESLVAFVTNEFNTGFMPGDIRLSTLSDSTVESKVGGTEDDRSVKNNPVTVNGTITKALMNPNSDLVAYSGFSTSNYINQTYSSDLDFGTGGFWFGVWLKMDNNSIHETIFTRGFDVGSDGSILFQIRPTGQLHNQISDDGDVTVDSILTTNTIDDGVWHFIECFVVGSTQNIYVDGIEWATGALSNAVGSLSNPIGVLNIGIRPGGSFPLTNGSIALFRASATVPTAEQRKHMFETERSMIFNKALIDGSSTAVTALDFNEKRNELSVGTSQGRSVFNNLTRVDYKPAGDIRSISSDGGIIFDGITTGSNIFVHELDLRKELLGK